MQPPAGIGLKLLLWILSHISISQAASPSSQKCDEALVTQLLHNAFTSSSVFASSYVPGYAKLNKRGGAGGWSPLDSDHYQWLQVDLGSRKQVTAVATQGRYSSSDWTTRYRLLYSDTGRNWKPYHQDGNIWAFAGNSNTESVVRHDLQNPVVARYLRIIPLDWSEEGRIGLRFEIYGCPYWADVINFDGQGVISYRFKMKKMKILKDVIALKFKTSESEGVILHGEGQQGDYITLELRRGRLLLQINLGSNQHGSILGHTSVTSGSLLDDHHWHSVVIERYRRNVNFTLDQHTQHFRTNGEFDHLDLDYELTFGGMPYSGKPVIGGRRNFKGCMESINYNGENITDLARRKKLDTSSFRNLTFSCVDTHTFPVFFNGTSFLQLPGRRDHNMVSVGFQFRSWNPSGLLLFSSLADGMLELALNDGKVTAHINVTQQKNMRVDIASGSGLNDGEWHDVRFLAKENFAMLTIDGDEASAVRTNSPVLITTGSTYHFGGYFLRTRASPIQRSFQGCMQLIQVDDQLADLTAVEQGRIGAFENVSLDMCAIIDRCMPNHCEHGGRCSQTWDSFTCTCDGTGYTGATCHTSVYEQSCEAYKHLGRSSDAYWIDPDGSGPLGPFKVICNMTEDKVWTTVVNNLPAQTAVTGSSRERRTVLQLNYSASMEQVTAITNSAEHCEQHVSYACRMSRLLNTPDGTPYTWWVGRGNEKHFYWGGSAPGIQKCACGIERNCSDSKYYCNCDADQKQWRDDSGLLVYKDHLPVSQVAVGDTNRPGSEAKLTVGPLRCHGDRSYWNAASFNTPSSYLHFSTFQGETSADISFYFKTSAPYGVFLENLGNTDFIRLELKSPMVVSFSFDVGNGPVELNVHSPTPLNDDQWHRVSAERNTKEAILQLDQKYKEIRPAPTQGHTRLELYSQLYVGAAGGQRGFLGCIRSLKMNGVTLDLEERAKVTPGVKPGCSGHCTSFGMYCRNGGKCVEKYNGYSCDCTTTAYDGPFCSKDVGGFFEAGTLVKYNLVPEVLAAASSLDEKSIIHNLPVETNLTHEDLTFSFSTSTSPSLLVYVSSKTQDYMAVVLRHNGTLQLRYSLGGLREPFTIDIDQRNLANGQPHTVNISRVERDIEVQLDHYPAVTYSLPEASDTQFTLVKSLFLGKVFETGYIDPVLIEKYNTPGFVGCLSRVQFNSIAPLKAALRSRGSVSVSHQGKLVESNCGASPLTIPPMSAATDPWHLDAGADFPFNEERVIPDGVNRNSAIIGGIIAVVIFTILCTLVFLIRYMFRHKGTYHTNEAKGGESSESADAAIIGTEANFTETIDESKKEWFI
ncbi:contactin-associated protein-like 2a precursor [Danio rerio]|uniref:Contactin-associated protein 2a n=1 Tax=Danio rerio TaxID=7955 RepID=L7NKH5_DANRE|nr:contactin-associated protein-like 2a precursor [Danio rerio]AEW99984.1 contactin-associated protein-like 2a alpha isoform [Danio rerio]|eukprot:NP_001268920.1 contactin-associated protein-like 2 precursor [Danio rerio]